MPWDPDENSDLIRVLEERLSHVREYRFNGPRGADDPNSVSIIKNSLGEWIMMFEDCFQENFKQDLEGAIKAAKKLAAVPPVQSKRVRDLIENFKLLSKDERDQFSTTVWADVLTSLGIG